ncbi:MAG: T9SS type A sorting domain-containing protein [Bacteroidota bacterium]
MKYMLRITLLFCAFLIMSGWSSAQQITIKSEEYKQQFDGAGVSIGLFLGHHYSMSEENQDRAIQMINRDLNMQYLQDYIGIYPVDDPAYFDRRADYIKAAKAYRPDIEVSMVGNIFPDNLRTDVTFQGNTYRVLDTDDPEIYDKLAGWYFDLFQGFKDRGVDVDILNVVNEPDLGNCANQCRRLHYGQNGDTEKGVSLIFTQAVTKFKEMLNDPEINTSGMKVPLIMGPSTISPNGALNYIRYFKANYPEAWNQIDIVATHQYINGDREDLFEELLVESEGKIIHQSETHASRFANQADRLGTLPVSDGHRTALSFARLFGTAINNGVNAWYYFENNYPNDFHPGGLIRVFWQDDDPAPYKQYYAFQQLTSAQPPFSHVVERTLDNVTDTEVTTFRKIGEDTVYVNITNFSGEAKAYLVDIESATIRSVSANVTDATLNNEQQLNETFSTPKENLIYRAEKYSVNTLRIAITNVVSSISDTFDRDKSLDVWRQGDFLMVQNNTANPIKSLTLLSMDGKKQKSIELIDKNYFELNVQGLASGVYILNVVTNSASESRKVLISN